MISRAGGEQVVRPPETDLAQRPFADVVVDLDADRCRHRG